MIVNSILVLGDRTTKPLIYVLARVVLGDWTTRSSIQRRGAWPTRCLATWIKRFASHLGAAEEAAHLCARAGRTLVLRRKPLLTASALQNDSTPCPIFVFMCARCRGIAPSMKDRRVYECRRRECRSPPRGADTEGQNRRGEQEKR